MAVTHYLRRARVEVGGGGEVTTIDDRLRITFGSSRSKARDERPTRIEVYNLSGTTAEQIRQIGNVVRLSAGWGEQLGVIHTGEVIESAHRRSGTERITTLVVAGAQERSRLGDLVKLSYEGPIALAVIVRGIAEQAGLTVGPVDALAGLTVDGWADAGSPAAALTELLAPFDVLWWEEAGELRFGAEAEGSPTLEASETSGLLVGLPELTEDGVKATILLTPSVDLDQRVTVRSEDVDGEFRVASLIHRGDTWSSGRHVTELELRPA